MTVQANSLSQNSLVDLRDGIEKPSITPLAAAAVAYQLGAMFDRLQAVKSEEQELAEILKKYTPKDPKSPYDRAIYNAVKSGDENAVRLLIKHKATQDIDRSIVLDLAIKSKSLSLVKYLVEEEKYASEKELYSCARYDFFEGFDYFRNRGHQIPKDIIARSIYGNDKYFLDIWGVGSDMGRVNFLISKGADLSCIENSPELLNLAINADDMELMHFLLLNKAYLKMNELSWGSHPLNWAFCGGFLSLELSKRIEYAKLIADSGMKIDSKFSKMIWAKFLDLHYLDKGKLYSQEAGLLKSLLAAGMSLNDFPFSDESALQYAIHVFKDYDLVEFMLKMGADPNHRGSVETPLQTAIKLGDEKIIALLIKYGADLNNV